jgi:hypothetical protein
MGMKWKELINYDTLSIDYLIYCCTNNIYEEKKMFWYDMKTRKGFARFYESKKSKVDQLYLISAIFYQDYFFACDKVLYDNYLAKKMIEKVIGQKVKENIELVGSSLLGSLDEQNLEITTKIAFFPQGLVMSFYGSLGILLSLYWWFLIFWNVGAGFNEFNKKEGFIRVFRWGYPGKNRKIDLSYSLKDVEAIKVELKQGLDPQRTIYLRLKGNREIPITGIGQPLTLKDIEKQASELANFLQVSLEGL